MAVAAKIGVKVISVVIGIPVSIATRKLVEAAWHKARPENPPRNPSEEGVRWVDAVAWGAASAVSVVVADLVTRRGTEATYRAITGSEPPPGKQTKAAKKGQKKAAKSQQQAEATAKVTAS